jgi:DNA topoisomerase-6 subunit B
MAKSSEAPNMKSFLKMEFNRISDNVADEILEKSGLDKSKDPKQLSLPEIKLLKETFSKVKLMPPPTDCLSGLGPEFIRKGLKSVYGENKPSHYSKPISRPVSIYNGNPFSVEAGLVFGGNLRADEPIRIVRFANKVPLLYQPGACVITKSISEMDWRPYGFDQKGGTGIPFGPAIVFVHVYGIRMPFTSESKEAIASVPEISNEISAALKMLGRGVKLFLGKKDRRQKVYEKFRLVSALLPEIGRKSASILGKPSPELDPVISKIANVVFVTEEINKQGEVFNIRVRAINYTKNKISMKLFADPATGDDIPQNLQWEIDALEPSKEFSAQFSIPAVQDYQGTNYYFTGIDPVRVQGAEPLPADFGTGSVEVMETEDEENVTK